MNEEILGKLDELIEDIYTSSENTILSTRLRPTLNALKRYRSSISEFPKDVSAFYRETGELPILGTTSNKSKRFKTYSYQIVENLIKGRPVQEVGKELISRIVNV